MNCEPFLLHNFIIYGMIFSVLYLLIFHTLNSTIRPAAINCPCNLLIKCKRCSPCWQQTEGSSHTSSALPSPTVGTGQWQHHDATTPYMSSSLTSSYITYDEIVLSLISQVISLHLHLCILTMSLIQCSSSLLKITVPFLSFLIKEHFS